MAWKLTIKSPASKSFQRTTIRSTEEWEHAKSQTTRKLGEGDLAYRCRAWSAYLGETVFDWEWED